MPRHRAPAHVADLVFVGFNRRVAALQRSSGELVWQWKAPRGTGYVALLVEDATLFVSVDGYTYSLDGRTGAELWRNDLAGFGTGVACLATSTAVAAGGAAAELRRRESSSSSSTAATTP